MTQFIDEKIEFRNELNSLNVGYIGAIVGMNIAFLAGSGWHFL